MSGWTSLFKRAPKLKADPLIRWFGKMPATREYNDYYRSAGEPWMCEFHEDFLIRGYELYCQRARAARQGRSAAHERLPVSSCVLRLPKSGMTVLAAILDFGGDMIGRQFPMCFHVGLPTADWIGPTSDRICATLRILRQLVNLQRDVARFLNEPGSKKPEQFTALFRGREVSFDGAVEPDGEAWLRAAQGVRMSDWFMRAGGGLGAADAGAWIERADRWGKRIAEAECEDFEPTLSFPVVGGLSLEAQVAGWVRWLEARMRLDQRAVSLMLTEEPAPRLSRLSIVARDLMSEDFLLLTPLCSELTYLDDLAAVREDVSARENGGGNGAKPAPTTDPTWAEFAHSKAKLAS